MTLDIAHLTSWIGRTETRSDIISPCAASALAATLNREKMSFAKDDVLPPLWHWLYFPPVFRLSDAGPDGHERLGRFLPPVPLPRRMWAGGRVSFQRPIQIGMRLEKRSTITDVVHKKGRTGDLVFVTVRHEVLDGVDPCVIEEQDLVYRDRPTGSAVPSRTRSSAREATLSQQVEPSPVMLFRYSALTFNGHRIHYDRAFANEVEGYPGLVVHGPLLATLIAELFTKGPDPTTLSRFTFQGRTPLFDGQPFGVYATPGDGAGGWKCWVEDHAGAMAMTATVETGGNPTS